MTDEYTPSAAEAEAHALVVTALTHLVNLTAAYLNAEGEAEQVAQDALAEALEEFSEGHVFASDLLMAMASMIVATVPNEVAQGWLDHQAQKIEQTLGTTP